MKDLTVSLALICVVFISCGDDPVTQNNNNNGNGTSDSLVFELDTLFLGGVGNSSVTYFQFITLNSFPANLKVNFTSETDCIANENPLCRITLKKVSGVNTFIYLDSALTALNNAHSLKASEISLLTQPETIDFELRMSFSSNLYRVIRLLNIKVYKIINN